MKMRCEDIHATEATQVRVHLSKETIDQYREELETGADFPPIVVFAEKNSERYILADGHHRLYAHIHAGLEEIEVDLMEGDKHAALLYAASSNRLHGLRMSNADKVKCLEMLLDDPTARELSQRELGDIVGVTRETVNRVSRRKTIREAKESEVDSEPEQPEENKPENVRPTKPEPTQQEIERGELRQALSLIKAFPYDGEQALSLELTADDIADLEYVSTWTAGAVIAYRTPKAVVDAK